MRIYQVDAFTDRPFRGNPAAVCVLEQPAEPGWMQSLALEMNLSETAFVHREGDGYQIRWFTPTAEVALCGHATLASAHVLWHELGGEGPLTFGSLSGPLGATRQADWIELDFPAKLESACQPPAGLLEALGAEPVYVGRNQFDYLVELASEEAVRELAPDLGALARVEARGVIVTARGQAEVDFVSRFFAPAVGVPEDPVTGSAHCCLGPFWASRLDKQRLLAYQASSRGGVVRVTVRGQRVGLAGQAVTVMVAELGPSSRPPEPSAAPARRLE
ncbi:MAG: PhzF family phenazine biosynthesis protein [Vulcanimicrobiota bacterium]